MNRRASKHFARPAGARGILPLIMGALSVGKAIYGAVSANQAKQRNKGYINDAYRTATARMDQQQAYGAQGNLEESNARGLLSGGVGPIHAAMLNGSSSASDLAGQSQANLYREYGLDRHALDSEHERDLNENRAAGINGEIGAIAGGIKGVAGAYNAQQEQNMMGDMDKTTAGTSPVHSALLSRGSWGGIHPNSPIDEPSSAFHMPTDQGTILGTGQSNAQFNG